MSSFCRPLPDSPSVASLRKQAKQLHKAFKAGEPEALARVEARSLAATDKWSLRHAQSVVAQEYGFASWHDLRAAVDQVIAARDAAKSADPAATARLFLDLACLTYSGEESPRRIQRAARLLAAHPEVADQSPFVFAACGDRERLAAVLDTDRESDRQRRPMASEPGGPRNWPPLLYLCYSRVAQTDALGTATLLLDCGADPNASYLWPEPTGPNKYTALTGVFGRGEAGPIAEPPHRDQRALALLLLARGADPNDGQTLYQCHFDDDDTFLEVLFEGGLDVSTIERSMLATAAAKGYAKRVALLLAHGFDPNAEDRGGRSAYHNALLHGHDTIAQALVAAGATTTPLSDRDSLRAACFRGDAETARVLAAAHPELLDDASLLVGAAGDGNLEAVRLLLDLGLAPSAANDHGATALHQAAFGGHTGVVRELLARGAPVDVNESAHGATPASWADHAGHKELAHLIAGHSNNALDVTFHAHFPRLRALLDEDPNALSICDRHGHSALHYVDPNRADAPDLVRFLIAHGAPLDATSEWGETALGRFLRVGAEGLADLMIEAGASE